MRADTTLGRRRRLRRATMAVSNALLGALMLCPAVSARAQQTDTVRTQLGGLIYSHFRYGGEASERSQNRFELERAYVDVRSSLSPRISARITADIFQQSDPERADYYGGWAFRAKYAWLEYGIPASDSATLGLGGAARLGIIGTVIVEVVDEHWPRFISKSPVDRYGFMSTADAGAGVQLVTRQEHVELYATVVNGEGYQRGEVDRFKDYAARLRLRPLASARSWARDFSVTPWASIGDLGSRFAEGPGTVTPVRRGLDRHMWGVFAGLPARAFTLGAEFAERRDETEAADTLVDVTPIFSERTTEVVSGFAVVRPFELLDTASTIPLGLVARFDRLTTNAVPEGHANVIIAGVTWDLGRRASLALDYQEESPHGGYPLPSTRTWYLHTVVRF